MASVQAYDAIHDYLDTVWTVTPIAFENDGYDPPSDPEHWILVEIFGDFIEQESIGAEARSGNLWREGGQLYVSVMAPRGSGTRQARIFAGQIVDLFRGLDIGSITFLNASIGAGERGETDGSYFRITATIDWSRDL